MDRLKILVIDDDAGDRMILRRLLRRSGLDANLAEAENARGASDGLDGSPDFIFLDYCIPGEEALTTLGRLRELWPASATCVVTGQGDEQTAASVLKAGAADYVPKRVLSEPAVKRIVEGGVRMSRLRTEVEAQQEALHSFAYVLAHDMKSPLRAIGFLQEVLCEDLDADGDIEAAKRQAKKIGEYARRAMDLIDSLTSHIRLDGAPKMEICDLTDLAHAATENLHIEIASTRAEVVIGDLPTVTGAPAEYVQLFQNLIANGIKYCRNRAPNIRIKAGTDTAGRVTVSVADNGIGIAAEDASMIFEPFKRLHAQDEFSGSGLGLATCRKIVERHEGRIWCTSKPGEGSTFTFVLGTAASAAAA